MKQDFASSRMTSTPESTLPSGVNAAITRSHNDAVDLLTTAEFYGANGRFPLIRRIKVMGCVAAEDFECNVPWACISIATTEDDFVQISRKNRRGLLQIAFADMTQPLPGLILFDGDHAHDILDFVTLQWPRIKLLMVHCEQGLSRSPAVAAAIARLKTGRYRRFFQDPYLPNGFVYRRLLETAAGRADYQRED